MSGEFGFTDDELWALPIVYATDLLKDQVFVISGGGGGIGRATAWAAARLGASVVVTGRKTEKLDAMHKALTARGLACEGQVLDISASGRRSMRALPPSWNGTGGLIR